MVESTVQLSFVRKFQRRVNSGDGSDLKLFFLPGKQGPKLAWTKVSNERDSAADWWLSTKQN